MFSWKRVLVLAAAFIGAFVAANTALGLLSAAGLSFHYTPYWPVNVFDESDVSWRYRLLLGVPVFGAFLVINRFLNRTSYPLILTLFAALALLVATTLFQGWDGGFYVPIAEDEYLGDPAPQYYHDAIKITGAADFIRQHNEIQPQLTLHAKTHPPGPVLLIYFLWKLLGDPKFIAIAIAVIAVPLSGVFFYLVCSTELKPETSRYLTFLLLLMPAIQIYYLATVDAVITGLLIGVVACFLRRGKAWLAGSVALLLLAIFCTVISLVIVPVIVALEWISARTLRRSVIVLTATAGIFAIIYFASGYSILATIRIGSALEHPEGFTGFRAPVAYLLSRIESVAEILLFFGPFLAALLWRATRRVQRNGSVLYLASCLAVASVGLLFLTGVFRVAETARACCFIYPFLLLPIGLLLEQTGAPTSAKKQLALLVFGQSILMQMAGSYFW